ncbi:hypothetical protein ACTHGU_20210 [Chitinophagaceae bacterium MMS25-I14]
MIDILIILYYAWRNSRRAQAKGQNGIVWGLITFVAFFFFEIAGTVLSVFFFYKGPMTFDALQRYMQNLPAITAIFIFISGLGGYLLIRYILDRMPDKPQTDKQ